MNLRAARVDDHWRRVLVRNYPTAFSQIALHNVASIEDCTVRFTAGISAIIGSNGVGKSTIAAAIAELLSKGTNVDAGHSDRLAGSEISGVARSEGVDCNLSIVGGTDGARVSGGEEFGGEFRWLDPSNLANSILRQIHSDQAFDALLEPITPLQLDSEELGMASYLVNRRYTEFSIFEISDYGTLDVFPYFRVNSSGAEYGSEGMGRGELSLLLTYWTLRDLPRNSILVIEEPETHVSPRSQDCLMNILAKFSDERSIWIIIATHSPTIIRRLPPEHVKLFTRGLGRSALVNHPTKAQMATILGGGVSFKTILLVEDNSAKEFLFGVLEEIAPDCLRQFDIVNAESESSITAALTSMPKAQKSVGLVGIYDGDMRDKVKIGPEVSWPAMFLPGNVSPDEMLREALQKPGTNPIIALELHKSQDQVVVALDHSVGVDHHEFVREFSVALAAESSVVRRGMIHLWLSVPQNRSEAEQFVHKLVAVTSS